MYLLFVFMPLGTLIYFCSRYIFKTPKSSGFKQYFSVHFMFADLMML